MKTIVVANQKGGTGKSTIAVHIGMGLRERDFKVAFVNCETQGNSSNTMKKAYPTALVVPATHLFSDKAGDYSGMGDLAIFEGGSALADLDKNQGGYFKAHVKLLSEHFDFCVIDTPPTASVLQIAPLTASDFVLSPVEMEDYSIQGVADMLKTIMGVKQRFNPGMSFLGMLPNRLKGNSPRQKAALGELLSKYPQFMFDAADGIKLGDRQAFPEALSDGMPVWKLKKTAAREAADEMDKFLSALLKKMGVES